MPTLTGLLIYPIKSLGGVPVTTVQLTDRGLQYDRRWMLVDLENQFLSQRRIPEMALVHIKLETAGLVVTAPGRTDPLLIPYHTENPETTEAILFDKKVLVQFCSQEADQWFSAVFEQPCRLVYMPEHSLRRVSEKYAFKQEITSLSDDFPVLLISQSSLDSLNSKLEEELKMNRFRPNLIIEGSMPFEEDTYRQLTIGGIPFRGAKPCARCQITTINQEDASMGKEPLKTLSTFRTIDHKIKFGMYLLPGGLGSLKLGDELVVE